MSERTIKIVPYGDRDDVIEVIKHKRPIRKCGSLKVAVVRKLNSSLDAFDDQWTRHDFELYYFNATEDDHCVRDADLVRSETVFKLKWTGVPFIQIVSYEDQNDTVCEFPSKVTFGSSLKVAVVRKLNSSLDASDDQLTNRDFDLYYFNATEDDRCVGSDELIRSEPLFKIKFVHNDSEEETKSNAESMSGEGDKQKRITFEVFHNKLTNDKPALVKERTDFYVIVETQKLVNANKLKNWDEAWKLCLGSIDYDGTASGGLRGLLRQKHAHFIWKRAKNSNRKKHNFRQLVHSMILVKSFKSSEEIPIGCDNVDDVGHLYEAGLEAIRKLCGVMHKFSVGGMSSRKKEQMNRLIRSKEGEWNKPLLEEIVNDINVALAKNQSI